MTVDDAIALLRKAGHRVTLSGDTDAAGAAALLGISESTLKNWNAAEKGPPRRVYGPARAAFYPIDHLVAFLEGCLVAAGKLGQPGATKANPDLAGDDARADHGTMKRKIA